MQRCGQMCDYQKLKIPLWARQDYFGVEFNCGLSDPFSFPAETDQQTRFFLQYQSVFVQYYPLYLIVIGTFVFVFP